ncbi:hypothetical protein WMY93_015337 [Mugilogobius chulae]|uniref:Reverse transcriptase domain-containing protein n=1 Tax=Mugilogobius chulae TaxID=88201 RepID=A0AAW0NQA2_9GOBI
MKKEGERRERMSDNSPLYCPWHCKCFLEISDLSTKTINPVTHSTLTNCISEIKSWLKLNYLQLNCNKTEIILIGPKSLTNANSSLTLSIDGTPVSSSSHLQNLGIIFDQTLSYEHHIKHITKNAFYHLRNIARLRPSLTPQSAEILIHAFVTSRLDYCNSLLYGSPAKLLNRLQYIQNSAARVLTHTSSCDHITPVLRDLHWLPSPNASTSSSSP